MFDADHGDSTGPIVDAVDDAVTAAARGMVASEFSAQRFAHSVRVIPQRTEEVGDGVRSLGRQRFGKRPAGSPVDAELVGLGVTPAGPPARGYDRSPASSLTPRRTRGVRARRGCE